MLRKALIVFAVAAAALSPNLASARGGHGGHGGHGFHGGGHFHHGFHGGGSGWYGSSAYYGGYSCWRWHRRVRVWVC
jgi:hypothetical protein